MTIIPAIDLIGGQCVRLQQGDYGKKTIYSSNPLEVAKEFEAIGVKQLHLVDLDGAKSGASQNLKVLELIGSQTGLKIDFGGGIRSLQDFEQVFRMGAAQVTAGSVAVYKLEVVREAIATFGAEQILLGADHSKGWVATHGWQTASAIGLDDHIAYYLGLGVDQVICTDISKDGMMQGPSIGKYKDLLTKFPKLRLIASGGVSGIQDLRELEQIGCDGAIIGKALYEGAVTLDQLEEFLKERNAD